MSSNRPVHLTDNGILTFCPRVPGLDNLYRSDELVYFDDLNDLVEKIRYCHLHDDERKSIAKAGWKRAHESFNADRITRFMIETIFKTPYNEPYEWLEGVY